ncbi:unnamed protein product [Medioppia subpectinata]|uniref:NAD(P)-binding protein n=1 Tax=Medioppia subpectinata TaxID=1979941 RepID=A0A7R9KVV1_9ACAR|nr:unnamed protein product [Medioppia subpectinata]CAG2110677.1 unnamed protein product [Medioppia subpectinata]
MTSIESVLITGANRGIGLGLVTALLIKPNGGPKQVIATTRQATNAALDELRDRHSNLHVLQLDGTDYKSFDGFAKQVANIVGDRGLDTLINNAGIAIASKLDAVTAADMLTNFEVNSVAPLMLTKALLPVLKKSGATKRKTTVANISSLGGCITNIHLAQATLGMVYPYFTSKAALDMITKCLSVDLAAYGINTVAVHPGHVQTDMGGSNGALTVDTSAEGILNVIRKLTDDDSGKLIGYDGTVHPY